jgi:hypothetical protein
MILIKYFKFFGWGSLLKFRRIENLVVTKTIGMEKVLINAKSWKNKVEIMEVMKN